MGYIDIHSHILPGVDDGSPDMEHSVAMLREAAQNGIEKIIVTPHQKEGRRCISPHSMKEAVKRLQIRAREESIPIRIYCGNELYYRSTLVPLLKNGSVCTLAESSYVLLEFSPSDEFSYIRNGVYEVVSAGYSPILAHGERYACLLKQEERIRELRDMGCCIQVNADSVLGKLGFGVKHYLHQLFCERLIQFVATDAHDLGKRGIHTEECAKRLKRKYGERYMMELLHDNAQCVIKDMEI